MPKKLRDGKPPQIKIFCYGGLVRAVYGSELAEVEVIDFDDAQNENESDAMSKKEVKAFETLNTLWPKKN